MRELGPPPECTCDHPVDCLHACHGRHCDPSENACAVEFLPDEGGLARWGCAECTPGQAAPHLSGCPIAEPGVLTRPAVGRLGHLASA